MLIYTCLLHQKKEFKACLCIRQNNNHSINKKIFVSCIVDFWPFSINLLVATFLGSNCGSYLFSKFSKILVNLLSLIKV